MIFLDVTKAASSRHRSGLVRVGARLAENFGLAAHQIAWPKWDRAVKRGDWFLTPELFSEAERPGFTAFLEERPCRFAAIFHDAIPLKLPHITWPHSVARHPYYLKLLSRFDCVWAVSEASRRELLGFWEWQGIEKPPPVETLALGADFNATPRAPGRQFAPVPRLLCVGILEPRKNQLFLFDVCESLWRDGLKFELHIVGRVNPHFGAPVLARLKELRRRFPGLRYHENANDAEVAQLYTASRASVFPTLAEGCGLPLLESLWMGVPCVCSDLPVLRENADGGGCLPVALNDRAAWKTALHRILTDEALCARLSDEAATRELPTWASATRSMLKVMQAERLKLQQ
jgi:glycosyltransferase involved in cell wall biosynthesis